MGETGIPDVALKLTERNELFRMYISNLNLTVNWYNKIRQSTKEVENDLIESDIIEIDNLVSLGQNNLNWHSNGTKACKFYDIFHILLSILFEIYLELWDYLTSLHKLVGNLQNNLQVCQNNLNEIRNLLIPFTRQPLLERKDGKKNEVLCIEEKEERLTRRITEIKEATAKISILLDENMNLFKMVDQQDNIKWINYVNHVDNIVFNYLYQSVGCR